MKRLGMLLVLVSVSLFALGCGDAKKDKKPTTTPAAADKGGAAETPAPPAAPAAPEAPKEK